MKIQTIVYKNSIPWQLQDELNTHLFNNSDADIVLFPGWSFNDTNQIENFQNSLSNKNTFGVLELKELHSRELKNALFSIQNGEIKFSSFQLFSTSTEITNNIVLGQIFVNQFATAKAFKVKNKTVRVIQCGELNILRNEQANGNRVQFRVDDNKLEKVFRALLKDTSIILNPLHTPMGNQGKMHARRKFLSSNKRLYISTSNVKTETDLEKSKSAHYVYYDGHEMQRYMVDKGKYHSLYQYEINF
jgi:hypothetical protein